jgi:membrane-associated phospholipid phosphatase
MEPVGTIRPKFWKPLLCASLLAAMFVAIYGGTNWVSSIRNDVGQLYFAWELKHIPLIPAMIVPYTSLDILFIMAFFRCRNDQELKALTARLATALLAAGVCFLICPLRIGFERPRIPGFYGWLFSTLHGLDKPFNLAPSLHVAIAMIVGAVYVPRSRGFMRWLVAGWFVIIALSTLFTWQHQAIDVISGGALGLACLGIGQKQVDRAEPFLLSPVRGGEGG